MQFEYDPERLIEEVKKRPGIWDYEDPEYRTKNFRYKLWTEVVNELMHPDVKVSKGEMRELEIQLQKKWKGIRDCFQKYITNPKRTRRPYIYNKQLQFLLKNHEVPQQKEDGDISSESDEVLKPKKVWRAKKKVKIVKDEDQSTEDETYLAETLDESRDYSNNEGDTSPKAKAATVNKTRVDEFAFANVDTLSKSDDDPDKMFLLSLLPHLKTIPEEFRLNVKMELMQVLRNANYSTTGDYKLI